MSIFVENCKYYEVFFSVLLSVILRASFEKFEFWTKIHEWTFYCGTSQIYRKKGQQKCKKTRGEK